jgi:hypothetical protein
MRFQTHQWRSSMTTNPIGCTSAPVSLSTMVAQLGCGAISTPPKRLALPQANLTLVFLDAPTNTHR